MPKGGNGGGGGKPGGGGGTAFAILGLDAASDDGAPGDDITSLNNDLVLTGTIDPSLLSDTNFVLTIFINDDPYAVTDIDPDTGNWSYTYADGPLADGEVTVEASYTHTHPKNGKVQTKNATPYTFTVESGGGNAAPNAVDDTANTDEDNGVTISVLDNDTDGDNDPLTVTGVSDGSVTLNPDGTITYTPDANWSGVATFTYDISDGNGGTDTATVTVTVNAVNDAPSTADDDVTTDEDTAHVFNVLTNDSDIDGDALTLVAVDDPANGSVTFSDDGTITYTPDPGYSGSESFGYTVSDGTTTSTGTVNVTVNPDPSGNTDPDAVDDSASTNEDSGITIAVLDNDSDPDGDTVSLDSASGASNGSVTLNPDGTITYTPSVNWSGQDSFTYDITDGNGGTATATVTVTVNAVNDAPDAVDDSATTDEDVAVVIDVLANDDDIDGDAMSVTIDSQGANGTASVNQDGTITYTADADFNGNDSFTYQVADGNGGFDTATVDVTVNSVNDAPDAVDDSTATDNETPVVISVLDNDTDPDDDVLMVLSATNGSNGTVAINGDGTITYTANAGYVGNDSFSYTVGDGFGGEDIATVTVAVSAPPPPNPRNPYNDPLYSSQWHLTMLGNLASVWAEYDGSGVSVGIYDNGIDYDHPDLWDNYDATKHVTVDGNVLDPAPYTDPSNPSGSNSITAEHGTAVAGVIAAVDNTVGTVGVAFGASLTGINIFGGPADINGHLAGGSVEGYAEAIGQAWTFDIINNSWGAAPDFNNETDASTLAGLAAFQTAVETGRGGLGTIIVKAAGNDYDNAQGDFLNASRYTIVVAAHDEDGDASWYTNRGANVLVSAPSSGSSADNDRGIVTTDEAGFNDILMEDEGYDPGEYTTGFGGTSSATPVVSGVVALMLEANDGLGWRDVQSILAYSAHYLNIDQNVTAPVPVSGGGTVDFPVDFFDWFYNGAGNWNGGGLHFSEDYGFGGVDAYNAVRMAEVWSLFDEAQVSSNEVSVTGALQTPGLAFDNQWVGSGYTYTQAMADANPMDLEYIDVYVEFRAGDGSLFADMSDISLELVSASGTVVSLIQSTNDLSGPDVYASTNSFLPALGGTINWTYGINAFRGEDLAGDWIVRIVDVDDDPFGGGDGGTLNEFQLTFYGAAADQNDVYHYTAEMLTLGLDGDSDRVDLDDSGGTDWFDFAASAGDIVMDMSAGGITTLNGVTIVDTTAGTVIENAVGGDGDDTFLGNDAANEIHAMRGVDTVDAGLGDDTVWLGDGDDMFLFFDGDGADWIGDFTAGAGTDDVITLTGTGFGDFNSLDLSYSGGNAIVDLGGGDMITLAGLSSGALHEDDFVFV